MSIKNKIKVGIVGASGYTGGELLRLLVHHEGVEIVFAYSTTNNGKLVSDVYSELIDEINIEFTNTIKESDVIFLCQGHGKSYDFLLTSSINQKTKIIDLSQDFRLEKSITIGKNTRKFTYGLPELQKNLIKSSKNIANPGCFATALQLALLPSINSNIINGDIHSNAITGSTGAGIIPSNTTHFSWRNNNVSSYKEFNHQHLDEIKYTFNKKSIKKYNLNFIPLRGSFTRGIFSTNYFNCESKINDVKEIYKQFYYNHPFIIISENEINLKQVINTNKCILHLSLLNGKLIITSIIDNLLKGASGQAVQNMNLMFGLNETEGLRLKSSIF
ncbi:N-acetyl-gamma-glutamyl-phosphate reductase [Flavobacteriaceae bacterium]|jgi:N-acetyl-gamma-glutamyl-phosphate reductase|nr:N-acetyl-gamma-glutamyl-phosphate reductase [Flavobacteriaceae bacterium]MBT7573764.1 N-acetyl-gamma-glutamyl-phosphate reductase [Flavobacteriaceae bacterium]MDA8559189.1 N-acetyl-gamma-glutamyl-phosphate reductase [Flavobacteriaceae bacterium]MDB2383957.1 N-acetyl-gamma-glutamyl-phosphate reductase [Flavobacteriaceae bacterium]|tara:strand:+ start:3332 stop:4324 length:993 start_codon:yes stop_codon:yes gene_type:complete